MARAVRTTLAILGMLVSVGTAVAHADRDVLWHIVNGQCVPDQLQRRDPAPCVEVDLSAGEQHGYAVFKDSDGVAQYLLIPTARVTGVEDPALRAPDAPNYFAQAWRARAFTEAAAGGALPRDWISLAVNSAGARSQDQLHIHIDCLSADVHGVLGDSSHLIGPDWSPLPVPLAGHRYEAVRIPDLDAVNPFILAAPDPADAAATTVVVVGGGTEAAPEFVLLRSRSDPASSDPAAGEQLQDHDGCPTPLPVGPFTGK